MSNAVYERAVDELRGLFGAYQPLQSGNGGRFMSVGRGKATLYHANIAPGNRVEIAFETASFAARAGLSVAQARAALAELRDLTGQPVRVHPRFQWSRVGIATGEQLAAVVARLRTLLDRAA